jgi:GDP-L-fucose synthase
VKRLLNIASSCMYPRDIESPLKESFILKGELEPSNEGYALAKIMVTRLCEYIGRMDASRHYKTLISCNLYGRFDKFSPEHSHLIPAIIHKLHLAKSNNQQTVIMWGDGTARREFMYAADAADAILFALNHFDQLPVMTNIGLGYDYTINEYYETVAKVMNWNGEFVYDLTQPVGMKQKCVCTQNMQRLGWVAKTTLEQGLSKTISYYIESLQHER